MSPNVATYKIQKALVYQKLLAKPFWGKVKEFEDLHQEVENEVKSIITDKLDILLGVKPEPTLEAVERHELQEIYQAVCSLADKLQNRSDGFSSTEKQALQALAKAALGEQPLNSPVESTASANTVPATDTETSANRKIIKRKLSPGQTFQRRMPDGSFITVDEIELDVTPQVKPDAKDMLPLTRLLAPQQELILAQTQVDRAQSDSFTQNLINLAVSGSNYNE